MTTSIKRLVCGIFAPLSVAAVMFCVGGCADMMTNTRIDREQAIKLYNEGQYADAAGSFRETIKHNPADVQSHYYLAQSLDHLGAYEQAIQQYRTTLRIMETSLEGIENRPLRLRTLDQLATAVAKAQDHDPSTAMLHGGNTAEDQYLRAKIESKLGDADAALEAYQRSTLIDGKDAEVHRDYGLYLAQLGQTERARLELKRAYALNPDDQQTSAGLRRVGVVPGPSLKDESDMAHPLVPVGPIPELQIPGLQQPAPGTGDGQRAAASPKD
jgi:tetratricopeptide (TPR) repeat protein